MSVKFTTFGSLSMLIERSDGFRILVDPYITGNPQADVALESLYDVDLILVSHVAFDHFGDAPAIFAQGHAKMLCDRTSYKKMFDMNMINSSTGDPDAVAKVLTNGFSDPDLVKLLGDAVG